MTTADRDTQHANIAAIHAAATKLELTPAINAEDDGYVCATWSKRMVRLGLPTGDIHVITFFSPGSTQPQHEVILFDFEANLTVESMPAVLVALEEAQSLLGRVAEAL
ncbi:MULTISPECIES: hypothetical protein [Gordonia]|uniref:Uncharacterized protein n=1 Tax=Gordonia sihwensis NBRC 108236 TaxID=1223544 RepID=L7LNE6_9ACTN|nr:MULTISPECIES: hypothetical protein [Gordonia]AUH69672.1 hypothetical protein CXX93_16795 [Gordonia sp. YC-JH1]GAC62655.1 hypothetical protein GSI01S_39_00530 [Gordonia sihwensis NBRC 108236]